MKESIELHTIGIFRGKEYEMEELMNGLLEENNRLNNIIEKFEEDLEREINTKEEDTEVPHDRFLLINDTLEAVLRRFRNIKGVDKE